METEREFERRLEDADIARQHALENIPLEPIQHVITAPVKDIQKERTRTGKEEAENDRDLERLGSDFRDTMANEHAPEIIYKNEKVSDIDTADIQPEAQILPFFAEFDYPSDASTTSSSHSSPSEGDKPFMESDATFDAFGVPISESLNPPPHPSTLPPRPSWRSLQQLLPEGPADIVADMFETMNEMLSTIPAPPAHPATLPPAQKWKDMQKMRSVYGKGAEVTEEEESFGKTDYGVDVWDSGALESMHSIVNMSTVASTVRQLKGELEEAITTARSQRLLRDRTALTRTEYEQLANDMQEEAETLRTTIDGMVANVVSMEHELAARRRRWMNAVEKYNALQRKMALQDNLLASTLRKVTSLSADIATHEAQLQRLQSSFTQEMDLSTREMMEDAAMMRAIQGERRLFPSASSPSVGATSASNPALLYRGAPQGNFPPMTMPSIPIQSLGMPFDSTNQMPSSMPSTSSTSMPITESMPTSGSMRTAMPQTPPPIPPRTYDMSSFVVSPSTNTRYSGSATPPSSEARRRHSTSSSIDTPKSSGVDVPIGWRP